MGLSFGFEVRALPPFRLDFTAWALRRRPGNVVDRWDGRTYRRVLVVEGRPVEVAVSQAARSDATLHVEVSGVERSAEVKTAVTGVIERVLGTKTDCAGFYVTAARNAEAHRLASRFRGLKPPRFPTVFEALVNGIACQQLSLDVGMNVLNRLAEATGEAMALQTGVAYAFPLPHDVGRLTGDDLRAMGFSRQKARALLDLSQAITEGGAQVESLGGLDNEGVSKVLQGLRGVGRWTAEYVMLRGLGRLDVFPGDDAGARKRLQSWLHLQGPLSYEAVRKLVEPWHPYGGFVYFHLLLAGLAAKGYVK